MLDLHLFLGRPLKFMTWQKFKRSVVDRYSTLTFTSCRNWLFQSVVFFWYQFPKVIRLRWFNIKLTSKVDRAVCCRVLLEGIEQSGWRWFLLPLTLSVHCKAHKEEEYYVMFTVILGDDSYEGRWYIQTFKNWKWMCILYLVLILIYYYTILL